MTGKGNPNGTPATADAAKSLTPMPYHHGRLATALVDAAEVVLRRDGLEGLTLRAAAREAGVSHAAPKNHFNDLRGLLSELAARGFERFAAAMQQARDSAAEPIARRNAIGRAYVAFALADPAMFVLMFRAERLDFERPSLKAASDAAFGVLSGTISALPAESGRTTAPGQAASLVTYDVLPFASAGRPPMPARAAVPVVAAWALVHGFAMLAIDGRLAPMLRGLAAGAGPLDLLDMIFAGPPSGKAP